MGCNCLEGDSYSYNTNATKHDRIRALGARTNMIMRVCVSTCEAHWERVMSAVDFKHLPPSPAVCVCVCECICPSCVSVQVPTCHRVNMEARRQSRLLVSLPLPFCLRQGLLFFTMQYTRLTVQRAFSCPSFYLLFSHKSTHTHTHVLGIWTQVLAFEVTS